MSLKVLEHFVPPFLRFFVNFRLKTDVISVVDALVEARTILINMPVKLDDFGIALNFLEVVHDNFPKAKIDVITLDIYKNLLQDKGPYGMIFVEPRDINIFGLPKRELIQKITASNYDIALEMNNQYNLLGTYLCSKSGAMLRICLEDPKRDSFFNVSFRTQVNENLENKYRKLFKYLTANIGDTVSNL